MSRPLTVLEVFRVLKANRKRSYADIAKLIVAHFGDEPEDDHTTSTDKPERE